MNKGLNDVLRFEDFFRSFQDKQNRYKYRDVIVNLSKGKENVLYLSYDDLLLFDSHLAETLVNKPEVLIKDAKEAFINYLERIGHKSSNNDYLVRISIDSKNSPLEIPLIDLRSNVLSKLIMCKGRVVKKSQLEMRLKIGNFECTLCGSRFEVFQYSLKIRKPSFCANVRCKAKSSSDFRYISNGSSFYDYQIITIQDVAKNSKKKMKVMVTHDLVDVMNIGDIIEIIGIYSTEYDHLKKTKKNLFRGMIEANNA